MRLSIAFVLAVAVAFLAGCGKPDPLPSANQESAVAFVQPATVKVIAFGNVSGSYPSGAGLRTTAATFDVFSTEPMESVISAEFRNDQDTLPFGTDFTEYAWQKIAEHPDNYLFRLMEDETVQLDDVPYGIGTGVVVSEDGLILTCQHVIDDSDAVSPDFVYPSVERIYDMLTTEFGGEPAEKDLPAVANALIGFVMQYATFNVDFTEARVFFPLEWDGQTFDRPDSEVSPFLDLEATGNPVVERLKNWTYPCEVLAEGSSYPGKDVAILKAQDVSGLIAVDLADIDNVAQGETLHTLGFPGAAIINGMTEAASYLAVYHSGRVGQIMPMSDGWKAIHFDADINHGDSGGPVFNSSGVLVGLNVAGNPEAPGQNLAVPISLARESLKDHSISIQKGESTKKWQDAVLLMQAKRYEEALPKLEDLAKEIKVSQTLFKFQGQLGQDVAKKVANKYVQERLEQCRAALKKK